MGNFVTISDVFERKAKKLLKKFPTFGNTLQNLEQELIANPFSGSKLANNMYKVRFADKSKGKGKSGGFRTITYLVEANANSIEIILLTLYDKSEKDNISPAEIREIANQVLKNRNF